ncbi:MAG: PPOX class F420-dependent oxidoreductase [SAR324 cluster bacterium]
MTPELERARYISLVTFRKDGRAVATPVWCVAFGGKLYCYTHRDMGKAKRIRATGRVEAAPSDSRGRPLGAYSAGTGRVVSDPELEKRVYAELAAKYGWQYRLLDFAAWLGRRRKRRVAVELAV